MSSQAVLSQRALNRALLSRQLLLDRVDLPDEAGRRRAMVIQAVEHLVGLQAQAPEIGRASCRERVSCCV